MEFCIFKSCLPFSLLRRNPMRFQLNVSNWFQFCFLWLLPSQSANISRNHISQLQLRLTTQQLRKRSFSPAISLGQMTSILPAAVSVPNMKVGFSTFHHGKRKEKWLKCWRAADLLVEWGTTQPSSSVPDSPPPPRPIKYHSRPFLSRCRYFAEGYLVPLNPL